MIANKKSPADQPGNNQQNNDTIIATELVSFFQNFTDKNPKDIKVSDLVKDIQAGEWQRSIICLRKLKNEKPEQYSRDKSSLPFFTMAGTFDKRRKDGFLNPSGYIILDIDGLSLDHLEEIRGKIEADKYTAICFLSPSGAGLKVAFKASINNDTECKAAFAAISDYFRSKFNIELDKSGKDISRACFVSFDPAIYSNPDAAEFKYEVAASSPEPVKPIQAPITIGRVEKYILSVINGELERIATAGRGAGNEALNIAALKVAQLYHLGLFDKGPVKDYFTKAYLNRGNSYKNPIEASNTFESGWLTGIKTPREINQGGLP
jgi:hypothetical protein